MSEEILINVTPPESRVAVIENGVVQEVIIERTSSRGLVGNIYKGRVCRVLPGMQAAFVDIGLERAAFLHELSDASAAAIGRVLPRIARAVLEGAEIKSSLEDGLANTRVIRAIFTAGAEQRWVTI